MGVLPWLFVFYYAYPILWRVSHGQLTPLPPRMWVLGALFYVFVFVALPAVALYMGSIAFVVVRIDGDRITVGRWFGAWRRVYQASEVGTWHLVDRRTRRVAEVAAASMLRIDFLDGSWVSMPRYAWSFRKLDQWLRNGASSLAGVAASPPCVSPSPYRFVVRDPGMTVMVCFGWLLCWMVGALSITDTLSGKLGQPSGLGGLAWYALGLVVMGLLPLILGPLGAHLLLKVVRVDATGIHVHRWFGLVRRTYHEADIKSWRLSVDSNPPRRRHARDSLRLTFTDGASVFVTERATNFRLLHDYLRERVSARRDAGRISS
jgi:hypothetical protein